MTRSNNILQELNELGTTLANIESEQVYSIPQGYFESLPQIMLARVKALNANNSREELRYLSPVLDGYSKEMPYSLPAGYFEGLENRLKAAILHDKNSTIQTVEEELEIISPLLSGLNKQMPYSVPQGYFENLSSNMDETAVEKNTAKVIPFNRAKVVSFTHRKGFRMAVAAMITGIIALAGFLYFNNNTKTDPVKSLAKLEKKVDKEIKNTSDQDLSEFVQQFSLASLNGEEKAFNDPKAEPKEFLKDVPDKELKQFLQDTDDPDSDDDASLMN
jgi:hypothetical protein